MLGERQLAALTTLFQQGADSAAAALSKWLEQPATIVVESAQQASLAEVGEILGPSETPICACAMSVTGKLNGQVILAFDDESGLSLAEMLRSQTEPAGAGEWGEFEKSAVQETANIVGCAYLNVLAQRLGKEGSPCELTPSPPLFVRDFAESLMEFAAMNQAQVSDVVFFARAEFRVDRQPVRWSLVFVPEADGLAALVESLSA